LVKVIRNKFKCKEFCMLFQINKIEEYQISIKLKKNWYSTTFHFNIIPLVKIESSWSETKVDSSSSWPRSKVECETSQVEGRTKLIHVELQLSWLGLKSSRVGSDWRSSRFGLGLWTSRVGRTEVEPSRLGRSWAESVWTEVKPSLSRVKVKMS